MTHHVFLTGAKQVGKSTLLKKNHYARLTDRLAAFLLCVPVNI